MTNLLFAGSGIKTVDVVFFVICGVIAALMVAYYFLIPVINKKQYQEQRENLRKREESFKKNLDRLKYEKSQVVENNENNVEQVDSAEQK